jgi:pyruvate/2-oxoglutarate dehydrogenase complex dihydrolipoamide acyltransferase (E2) component
VTDQPLTTGHLHHVRMPKVGHGGIGVVRRWAVAEGDLVKEGDLLAEVELEKANVDVDSPVAGRVARLLVEEEEEVDAGTVIAHIDASGDR